MTKRIHYKNFVPKTKKHNLNQIFFKLHTNPRRFDFREQKPLERYKSTLAKIKKALVDKGLMKGANNEVSCNPA